MEFLKDKSCCHDRGGDDPDAQDCVDKWKEKLEEVSNKYTELSAETFKDEEEYQNSLGWQSRLENWNEIIRDTDEKADKIVAELEFFLGQAKIVCDFSEKTTDALEKLLGLVKCVFDCFFTYESNKEGLKDQITEFKKAIECLKNATDEDKAEVIKCIVAYEEKIMLVCEMQDAILTLLLKTYKHASLFSVSICGSGGLEDKIEDLENIFSGGGNNGSSISPSSSSDDDDDDDDKNKKSRKEKLRHDNNYTYPCNDMIVKPMPRFPISDSEYYKDIEKDLNKAIHETKELKKAWMSSKKDSDQYFSHQTSLIEAINAAEAAENA